MTNPDPTRRGVGQPERWLTAAVMGFFIVASITLALLIDNVESVKKDRAIFLYTCGMMLSCGVLGGSLYDIRGLIKHSSMGNFDSNYNLSYLLRPVAGALCALIALFLIVMGGLGFSTSISEDAGWNSFDGRIPFLGIGFLAGYSSQAFMLKLKDVADTLFSQQNKSKIDDVSEGKSGGG